MLDGLFASVGTGGPIVLLLIALSVLSLILILLKTFQLASVQSGKKQREGAIQQWKSGNRDGALHSISAGKSPADRVAAYAMKGLKNGVPRSALESEIERRGNAEVEEMGRNIRILELIAMISPLLGLLGTVLGMIQSFQELELAEGAANASVLAGGIWQALLTTAAGLIVAIPAAVAASLLAARVDRAAHLIETTVGQFLFAEDSGQKM